jgi:hypothetical protein
VNDSKGSPVEVPAGKTVNLRAAIPSGESTVAVRYTGSREVVILETDFQP